MLNAIEDRMELAVAKLPPGARVVSGVEDPWLHVFAVTHMVDRVCVGRCFSYANYEPSTWQFRIRTDRENAYVISDYQDSWKLGAGQYVVKKRDLPLLQLALDPDGSIAARPLEEGIACGLTPLHALL
jgi:hypothetical protein